MARPQPSSILFPYTTLFRSSIFLKETDGTSVAAVTIDGVTVNGLTTAATAGGDLIKIRRTNVGIPVTTAIAMGTPATKQDVALSATEGQILQGTAGEKVHGS